MVAFTADMLGRIWTAANGAGRFDASALREWSAGPDDRERLRAEVLRIRPLVADLRKEYAAHQRIREQHGDDPRMTGFQHESDEWLLDHMYRAGLFAEILLDQSESLTQYLQRLQAVRTERRVWCDEAEQLLADIIALRETLEWAERAARLWESQFCDEYQRRHPEAARLPFEPADLGPTNSARLPPVL
jgi:hypothetical protein